jgi:predicted nucleic acid-binding protein
LRLICDTCGVINAHKAAALDVVVLLEPYEFLISPAVDDESIQLRREVEKHIKSGKIQYADETSISAVSVANISATYNLGIRESECISLCLENAELVFWSDDRRARNVASELLGAHRVIGTADLLAEGVRQGLLSQLDAYAAYELARSRGAFLPALDREFF